MARRTATCYDARLLAHAAPGHPERPERLSATMALLEAAGMWPRLSPVPVTPAPRAALERVHSPRYVDALAQLSMEGGGWIDMAPTYVVAASYDAACLAAGGLLNVLAAVMRGDADNGFALIRPPGHHAVPAQGLGFCLFNNVAIAAAAALADYDVQRVLIVDWDVHHGNGTQDAFYGDDRVLFVSTHQYGAGFYPGTGRDDETGEGRGAGYNVNVPLPPGVGDDGYRRIFDEVVVPLARRYRPQLILVSAGYDAHWWDGIARMLVSVGGFATLTRQVLALADELCGGRIVFALEGGYDTDALAQSVLATLAVMQGDAPPADPIGPANRPETDTAPVVARVRRIHGL